ncbi:hypothetical protein G4B88_026904, partial [Cannabis sativa]
VSGVVLAMGLLLVTFKLREGHRVSKGSYYTVIAKDANKMQFPNLLHSYPDNLTSSSLLKTSCKYH